MTSLAPKPQIAHTLALFTREHAQAICSWVKDARNLRLLAPSSQFPLTPGHVLNWVKPGGTAYVLVDEPAAPSHHAAPIGYGELNPMAGGPGHVWIGHVIVDPRRRRVGLGASLTELLTREAFAEMNAERISLVVFPENIAAIACYEKAGFEFVREEQHSFGHRSPRFRLSRFEMHRKNWEARQ